MEYNFRNDIIRWQMSKSTTVSRTFFFTLALVVSKVLTFQICYLQKVGQVHGVHFSH